MTNDPARLNGRLAARWARRTVDRMRKERRDIDALNVFPVPDGDTGSNMYHTVRSAYRAVENLPGNVTLPDVVGAMATGALRGARGNSGLILSVALRGVADALEAVTVLDAPAFAGALELAAARADEAIADPVHGTMLTVLHAMAQEAREQADAHADLLTQIAAVRSRSRSALAQTTDQLDVLQAASVVDAGSTGIVELFDLLYLTVTGRDPETVGQAAARQAVAPPQPDHERRESAALAAHACQETGLEIVALLGEPRDRSRPLKRSLAKLGGTSIVISWPKVHVHVASEELAVKVMDLLAGLSVTQLRVEDLETIGEQDRTTEVLAVTAAPGLMLACALSEATVIRAGHEHTQALIDEAIAGATDSGAQPIVLTAAQAGAVVPSLVATPAHHVNVSGDVALLAALAVFDPCVEATALAEEMRQSAQLVRGAVLVRSRGTMAGPLMHTDDVWLVHERGLRRSLSGDLVTAVLATVESLVGDDGEILTVILGAGTLGRDVGAVRDALRRAHPQLSLDLIAGGDTAYAASIGVE